MSLVNKPDYEIFASNARDGEVLPIPNILRGWGETILLTERIPPMEWFNWLAKRQDEWLLYLTQQGIAEWSDKVTYPTAAITKFNGLFYVSLKETKGDNPANTQSAWKLLTEYFNIDGKLDKSAVIQTTGQSTTNVMSQKAVTDAIPLVPKNTASKSANGWWKCGDTGIIYQWGFRNNATNGTRVNFSQRFPNSFLSMTISDSDGNVVVGYQAADAGGFTLRSASNVGFRYIAIGY